MQIRLILVIILLLAGCASGSVIITGNKRPPICLPIQQNMSESAQAERRACLETIKLYSQEPKEYEVIGFVEATGKSGWTKQDKTNYAVKKLKELAAEIGANGVLLTSLGDKHAMVGGAMPMYGGGAIMYAAPVDQPSISGKAIYVIKE
ncbi:MAG: hypothetical protein HY026_05800 [Deltaproteobacteria bacterium]|nr:hypothetical protein [Deltaproteobacteria bacterium]